VSKRNINELSELAASLAEQVARNRGDENFVESAASRIEHGLQGLEERIAALAARSEPNSPICGYAAAGRQEHRTHYMRSWNGYGWGCDVCGGDHTNIPVFMGLWIGSHKARISLDLCKTCAKRLLNIIEARFEDKRRCKVEGK
jgi:hypothetical protein